MWFFRSVLRKQTSNNPVKNPLDTSTDIFTGYWIKKLAEVRLISQGNFKPVKWKVAIIFLHFN